MLKIVAKESNGVGVKTKGLRVSYLEVLAILDAIRTLLADFGSDVDTALKETDELNSMSEEEQRGHNGLNKLSTWL